MYILLYGTVIPIIALDLCCSTLNWPLVWMNLAPFSGSVTWKPYRYWVGLFQDACLWINYKACRITDSSYTSGKIGTSDVMSRNSIQKNFLYHAPRVLPQNLGLHLRNISVPFQGSIAGQWWGMCHFTSVCQGNLVPSQKHPLRPHGFEVERDTEKNCCPSHYLVRLDDLISWVSL
jgi:hypothetical protein